MSTVNKFLKAKCENCTLKDCPSVASKTVGNPKLVVVGEAPGATEVEKGEPFVGPSGQILDYALSQAGVSRDEVYMTNVVACRPPANRTPTPEEINNCLPRLIDELESVQSPVLALGKVATEALEMEQEDRGKVFTWYGRKAMRTYHPAYVIRKPSDGVVMFDDIKKFIGEPVYKNPKWEDPEVRHITTTDELKRVLNAVPDDTWVAFDIETDNIRWFKTYDGALPDPILMLQLAWTDDFGIVIDDVMLYDTPETIVILQEFFDRVKTVAHNGKFDQIFLRTHLGLFVHLDFDTMLAHAILDENSKHGLKELTFKYFNIPDYEERLIKQYLNNRNDRYSKIPFEPLAKYGVIDVIMTLQFKNLFEAELIKQDRLAWPFQNVIMRGANAFVNIEVRGIAVDIPYLKNVQTFLEKEMTEQVEIVRNMVAWPELNLNSTQQVATIIYDMLKMPAPRSRKLGPRSTNHEVLEALRGRHEIIDHILAYRHIAKMKSSYADNLLEAADHEGRVHANFLMQGTEIGRLSARNPALQTIPRPDDMYGALIRGAFVARPGYILLVVDYSQAELRVAAVLANEPFLFDVYENDRDLHSEVAKAMYGEGWTKAQRVRCKMFNFSYLYGGNEYSFAKDAGLPINVAKQFVQDYNKVMPNLADFRKSQYRKLLEQGYVQSPFGRRRHFELITNVNADEARKACVHAPIAGTASDLTLLSGCQLEEEKYNVVLLVHDSVVLEVPIDQIDYVSTHAQEVMESVGRKYLPEVKWKADPEARMRWADPPKEFLTQLS